MIIANIMCGIGNQLFQYAVGRSLAHRRGVELKLDTSWHVENKHQPFDLDKFNTRYSIASREEIERVQEINARRAQPLGKEKEGFVFDPKVLDYPDDVYLDGYFQSDRYFDDIADIIRDEFTLKTPPRGAGAAWLEKINAAECPVSLHIRHGDYATAHHRNIFGLLPLDWYRECVERLKQSEPRMTLFVFSNNLPWAKDNLKLGVPTEFVSGCERDVDELFLMSKCRHNIIANSTFSWWSAWLNPNPNKKVFMPTPWLRKLGPRDRVYFPDAWIRVPVDYDKNAPVLKTYSIILVTQNDEPFIVNALRSLLSQTHRYYEVLAVDNASTDRTFEILRANAPHDYRLLPLRTAAPLERSQVLNAALQRAQGEYIIFTDVRSMMLPNALQSVFDFNAEKKAEVFHSTKRLTESPNGPIGFLGKNFQVNDDAAFKQIPQLFNISGLPVAMRLRLIANGVMNDRLVNYVFRRQFLIDNAIGFEPTLEDASERLFLIKCLFKARNVWIAPLPLSATLA